jgi:putative ABC transport system ATP-binding protein
LKLPPGGATQGRSANEPSLILADEPTTALDSHRGRLVMELFRKVAHEHGAAVLVVTHDHRSLDVFDRTYEMEDGQLHSRHELHNLNKNVDSHKV